MIWALLLSLPVVLCALAMAWVLARRAGTGAGVGVGGGGGDGERFRLQVVGYPVDRVEEVLQRLDHQIAVNDAQLRGEAPAASAEAVPRTAVGADAREALPLALPVASADSVARATGSADARVGPGWGWVDLAVAAAYLATALHVLSGLIGRTSTGYLSQGVQDHQAFEWYFGASAHNVTTLSNPLFSDLPELPRRAST